MSDFIKLTFFPKNQTKYIIIHIALINALILIAFSLLGLINSEVNKTCEYLPKNVVFENMEGFNSFDSASQDLQNKSEFYSENIAGNKVNLACTGRVYALKPLNAYTQKIRVITDFIQDQSLLSLYGEYESVECMEHMPKNFAIITEETSQLIFETKDSLGKTFEALIGKDETSKATFVVSKIIKYSKTTKTLFGSYESLSNDRIFLSLDYIKDDLKLDSSVLDSMYYNYYIFDRDIKEEDLKYINTFKSHFMSFAGEVQSYKAGFLFLYNVIFVIIIFSILFNIVNQSFIFYSRFKTLNFDRTIKNIFYSSKNKIFWEYLASVFLLITVGFIIAILAYSLVGLIFFFAFDYFPVMNLLQVSILICEYILLLIFNICLFLIENRNYSQRLKEIRY